MRPSPADNLGRIDAAEHVLASPPEARRVGADARNRLGPPHGMQHVTLPSSSSRYYPPNVIPFCFTIRLLSTQYLAVTSSRIQSVRTRLLCCDKDEISQQELTICLCCRVRRPLWSVPYSDFGGPCHLSV